MKIMKKYLIIVLLIGAITGGAIAYYQFTRTHDEMASQISSAKISSDKLFSEFVNNEQVANEKYLGKVIEVSGEIYSIEKGNQEDINILFMTEGEMFGVSCNFKRSDLDSLPEPGQSITIKGECSGMLSDVIIIRCIIIN